MLRSLLITLSLTLLPFISAQPWDYSNQDAWGGTCTSGSRQSPIDLPVVGLDCSDYDTFSLGLDDSVPISFEYRDKNWIPVGNATSGFFEAEDIDGIVQLYRFTGASFHTFSEHFVNGQQAQLELQLRFTLDESDSPSTTENSTAIISVLMNRVQNTTSGFMQAVDMFVLENNNGTHKMTVKTPQLMSKILIDPQNFIMYQGSLTHPGCEENVNWYVVETPLLLQDDEIDFLLNSSDTNNTIGNYRNIQPVNGRPFKKICAVTLRVETLFQNPAFYFLSLLVLAGFFVWQSYGRIPPEEGKTFSANLWTIHPIISIVYIPNKESFSRRCRIALLYVTWLVQMIVECIAFRIQGHYKELYILYFGLTGVILSIPVTYTVGFFFRMYSKRSNENERLMHYDPTAMFRYMRTFKLISLCVIFFGLLFLYWQIAYLLGILAREWILSFIVGVFLDLCIFDSLAVLLSVKSHRIASLLKLRGYYFEGDISFYNIL